MTRRTGCAALLLAAGLSMAQVQLPNGVTVPRDRFYVYVLIGHCEMEGFTRVLSSDPDYGLYHTVNPRLWAYNVQDQCNPGEHHAWIPAEGKVQTGCSYWRSDPTAVGPAMPFLKELAARYPEHYFGAIMIANEGDRFRKQFVNDEVGWGGEHQWTQIREAVQALGSTVTWGGVFTQLGEMEQHDLKQGYAGAQEAVNGYAQDWLTFMTRLRAASGDPYLPLLYGDYHVGAWNEHEPGVYTEELFRQIAQIPSLVPSSAVVPTRFHSSLDSLRLLYYYDDHHYNARGHKALARNAADIIQARGWVGAAGADTQPPTAPASLRATNVGVTSVTLAWNASTDDRGLKEYVVYQAGDSVAVANTLSAQVSALTPLTAYTFTVRARDFAGNLSAPSNALSVTTADPGSDTQPPTIPGNLRALDIGLTSVTVAWDASSDNVAVVGYIVFRDGTPVDTVTALQCTVAGLVQGSRYSFAAAARDAVGNTSGPSAPLAVTLGATVAFPFKVDVGGAGVAGYAADKAWAGQDFGHTGTSQVFTGSGDVAGTDEDAAYHTLRAGTDLGYRVRVPAGLYDVTLMFAEFWQAAGTRAFTPMVNGVPVTSQPVDIAATVGQCVALDLTHRVEVTSGTLDVTFSYAGGTTSAQQPILNGLIVQEAPAYTLLAPVDQAAYHVGDTLHVCWEANTFLVTGTDIHITPDGGETWLLVNTEGTVFSSDPMWEDYRFVLPASLGGVTMTDVPLKVRLSAYNADHKAEMQGSFTVLGSTGVAGEPLSRPQSLGVHATGPGILVVSSGDAATRLEVCSLDGRVVGAWQLPARATATVDLGRCGAGAYVASLTARGRRTVHRFAYR